MRGELSQFVDDMVVTEQMVTTILEVGKGLERGVWHTGTGTGAQLLLSQTVLQLSCIILLFGSRYNLSTGFESL